MTDDAGARTIENGEEGRVPVVAQVSRSADVDPTAVLGDGTRVWHLAQIRESVVIGRECILGRGAYVGPGVRIGDNCKIQNYALIYEPAMLGAGVFIGPGAVLTNDRNPRAIDPSGRRKGPEDWEQVAVTVEEGASIGAGAVCVAPVTVGRWAMVAAGAVVTRDVVDFALVTGVPARQVGWVGRAGVPLVETEPGCWQCSWSLEIYREQDGKLVEDRSQ